MKTLIIYGFTDPRDQSIRYVGRTTRSAQERLKEMRCHARRRFPALAAWFLQLAAAGLSPATVILERNPPDGVAAEERWIARFREAGALLFNISSGGAGPNGVAHSWAWRRATAERQTGRRHTDAAKQKVSQANKGRPRPDVAAKNVAGAKLSPAAVEDVRRRLAAGERGSDLAAELGVARSVISEIKTGKRGKRRFVS